MDEEKLSFEQAMAKLEQIVTRLESGQCPLEESVRLFEEGTRLTALCHRSLNEAEQKIRQLTQARQAEPSEASAPEVP